MLDAVNRVRGDRVMFAPSAEVSIALDPPRCAPTLLDDEPARTDRGCRASIPGFVSWTRGISRGISRGRYLREISGTPTIWRAGTVQGISRTGRISMARSMSGDMFQSACSSRSEVSQEESLRDSRWFQCCSNGENQFADCRTPVFSRAARTSSSRRRFLPRSE